MSATANMLRESGASERPAWSALYSRTIWRKIGRAIIAPPSAICWSICWVIPIRKWMDRNRSGSSRVSAPARLRRRSHQPSTAIEMPPSAMRASTRSPPSCQTRIPSTIPPMPTTDSAAPTRSMPRLPVYGTSLTSPSPDSTTPMITTSMRNPTRHERKVVTNPPRSGPTAAAIAAAAPTIA